jgi:chromate transport protein ChrA
MTESSSPNTPSQNGTSPATWVGIGLIVMGALFLAGNLFDLPIGRNWWALILTLIGVMVLRNAWQSYQNAGNQITTTARSQGMVGTFMVLVSVMFLLGLDFGNLWPLFLILIGIMLLFRVSNSASDK